MSRPDAPTAMNEPTWQVELRVASSEGLHARPAAAFVRQAATYASRVWLINRTRGGEPRNAKSLTALLMAVVEPGHVVQINAQGPDAQEAVVALAALLGGDPDVAQCVA